MPALLVIRLLPEKPIDAASFETYLQGLTITAHDASFADPSGQAELLGSADYLPPPPPQPAPTGATVNAVTPIPDPNTEITQHFTIEPIFFGFFRRTMHSVATAVIEIPDAALAPEHKTVDVRLTIDRSGTAIENKRQYFNVRIAPGALPADPNDFPDISVGGDPVISLHLFLPSPGQEAGSSLVVPEDGTAPRFDLLRSEVEAVLNDDPGNLNSLATLTPAEARHVAKEIIWSAPLPVPGESLNDMYTGPNDPNSDEERARLIFQGDLTTLYVQNESTSERLANFVFSLSAAIWCEQQSTAADAAGLIFPPLTNKPDRVSKIKLRNVAATAPFTVPAEYFYALTAVLPLQVDRQRRLDIAMMESEAQSLASLDEAIQADIINEVAGTNRFQAARRLAALGLAREPRLPGHDIVGGSDVQTLITGWLGATTNDIATFWTGLNAAEQAGHFQLVLSAVTKEHGPLIAAIPAAPFSVTTVNELATTTDAEWLALFESDPTLLPEFTAPGTISERTAAFLRHLRKFLDATPFAQSAPPPGPSALPALERSPDNLIDQLALLVGLDLETFDPGVPANSAALDTMFPDSEGREAFVEWLNCIRHVLALTAGIEAPPSSPEIRFSVVEALWARGFIQSSHLDGFSLEEFTEALVGTVAHEHAATIFSNASPAPEVTEPKDPFFPANPHGALTNCLPPKHLSPLGPVAYLKELLLVSEEATCDDPLPDVDATTIGTALAQRRGPVGDLLASHSNTCVPIPLIDIVNESLEHMVAQNVGVGTVYNTSRNTLGGHELDTHLSPSEDANQHDAATLFEALPEHSTPATPTVEQGAWDELMGDFSNCNLPYHQPLDVARTYLKQLGTSHFETMRAFRKHITEFVLDPAGEPADFQTHLWRYPVRMPLALDYLCITPQEFEVLYSPGQLDPGQLPLHYGFLAGGADPDAWFDEITMLPVFLEPTCLSYCEFRELMESGFVDFQVRGGDDSNELPECEPCCLEEFTIVFIDPADPFAALKFLSVFIRLWRKLQSVKNAAYSFEELADICDVLELFNGTEANDDFIRQLAAFQMLRDDFELDLTDGTEPSASAIGVARTHLLSFWVPGATKFDWALQHLLNQIQQYALCHYHCKCRPPEFLKLLRDCLDPISRLAGFDPDNPAMTWHAHPTHTLRMAEILAKIYASNFGIGDILFFCTAGPQIQGGDPYPAQTDNEARDLPFDIPDNEPDNSLFALRGKLLAVEIDEDEVESWTWTRMGQVLHEEFGLPLPPDDDRWLRFGQHFFPSILEAEGESVTPAERVYEQALPLGSTSADMWNTPPGPFRYRSADQFLEASLPIADDAVIAKLARVRQLNGSERDAVSSIYFGPRTELAFFAFLFENQRHAERALIEERDEMVRWRWFQQAFAVFYARSHHLAEHVATHLDRIRGNTKADGAETAMLLLKHLWADENFALGPWEDDTGAVPNVQWNPKPNGGAFHALLSVVGTGLLAEYHSTTSGLIRWRELRGGIDAFGNRENAANAPLPTLIPHMNTTLSAEQLDYVAIRNGFTLDNKDGSPVGGAEPFLLHWHGLLLIEQCGQYGFRAGAPTPDGEYPDFELLQRFHRWRVTLRQGQKTWVLLAHDWPDEEAPAECATPIFLERGFYDISIEFERLPLFFDGPEDVCPQTTGFQIKYDGPDAGGTWQTIPHEKLFIATPINLDDGFDTGVTPPGVLGALAVRHTVSVRSMRRTMQRLVKAMLFAEGFSLGAVPVADSGQSELGFMLSQPENFAGQSYFDSGAGFVSHRANFDFNLLPVGDNYFPPDPSEDQRAAPSSQRRSAFFDWWERTFDYTVMRGATERSPEKPVWLLFHEAAETHVDEPAQLLRHMGVDIRHDLLVLRYYDVDEPTLFYQVTSSDLEDDRWSVRVWRADVWVRELRTNFLEKNIRDAETFLWASDGPEIQGLDNLTKFYRDGCIENGEPRRYEEINALNDGLRERGRSALLGYLTRLDRVALPWGGFVTSPSELSERLLIDVEAGICQKASRVEEVISAAQLFVSRARLGLEPFFTPGPGFAYGFDRKFSTFRIWQACKRREIYRESWISWGVDAVASGSEAYQFLTSELRRSDLTLPIRGGLTYWFPNDLPPHKALTLLQSREPATMTRLAPERQGLALLGTPDRHARPSWLAPLPAPDGGGSNGDDTPDDDDTPPDTSVPIPASAPPEREADDGHDFPMWFEAAVRLGTKFLRIAAAATPPASTTYVPKCNAPDPNQCCQNCGKVHPAHMDKYYFWIDESEEFRSGEQVAEWVPEGSVANAAAGQAISSTAWHDEEALPGLLHWEAVKTVRLNWCRVHNGEFQTPRRSFEGVELTSGQPPELVFSGRAGDSLVFEIENGVTPSGYPAQPPPGFRYDIAPDDAVRLPEIVAADPPDEVGGLVAFPFFAWHCPGSPILPPDKFGPVIAIATHLATHCRFEEALKWLELCWAPLEGDNIWADCDRPQVDLTLPPLTHVPDPNVLQPPVGRPGECCCPSDPVSDERAKRRYVLMSYLEVVLNWSDALMRQNTPEAFQRARLLADTAHKLLGPIPKTVVVKDVDESPASVSQVELACAPLNPQLMCLYTRVSDQLDIIRACLNARRFKNGEPNVEMPYFGEDRIRDCWRIEGDICLDEMFWCRPASPYRFSVLIERAKGICQELKNLGAQLLAAYEKGDAEYLAQLRSLHERQLNNLTLSIRQDQWREADWQVQALEKSKAIALTNLTYYQGLITAGLLVGEAQYEPLTGTATGLRAAGNVVEAIGQAMNLIPDPHVGFPCNFVKLPPGEKLAAIFAAAGRVVNVAADIVGTVAQLGLTKDGWERREDEWEHMVDIYTIEIEQIERQILAAERRRDIALRELNNHRQIMSNSAEVHDFLRDKFTSHALYLWLQKETSALHASTYELALHCAYQAERAYNIERGLTAERFVRHDAWDSLHEGLLSGERLSLALNRMEKSFYDKNRREYELTKHISLRLHFPTALLQLVATGRCEIELPEWLFDLDYPGHYMRRIRGFSLTAPCVVGSFTGVHCRVTLMSSEVRVSPDLFEPEHRCCDEGGCNNGYPALPEDNRIVRIYSASEAIATSGGQNDSGLFEFSFQDPRYLPFEYQGAVCRLCIELPHENNHFDVDTLTDLVLHLQYSAREGGNLLRRAATECARDHVPGDGVRFIDGKRELGGYWRKIVAPERCQKSEKEGEAQLLGLSVDRQQFPFLTGNRHPSVHRVEVLFEAPGARPSTHHSVTFYRGRQLDGIDPDRCKDDVFTMHCVGDAEWPGFYHGVLDIDSIVVDGNGKTNLGVLCFGPEITRLCNVFVLLGHTAEPGPEKCGVVQLCGDARNYT